MLSPSLDKSPSSQGSMLKILNGDRKHSGNIDTVEDSNSRKISRYMSISYESSYMGVESEEDMQKLHLLRKVPMLPAFGDIALAKFSVNYFLYMEFFHMIIRMLLGLFVFTGVLYIVFAIVKAKVAEAADLELDVQLGIGILGGFLVMWMQKGENRRLTRHYLLDDSQWSEDLFSLLVEDLPEDITKEEIKDYFQKIIESEHGIGKVKEVLLLQNVYDYTCIKKEHSEIRKRLRRLTLMKPEKDKSKEEMKEKEIEVLASKKKELRALKVNMKTKLTTFEYFQGKAIVIFDKIGAQASVNRYFNSSYWKIIYIKLFSRWLKKYQIKGKRITVNELPEPQNLIFENLDYPKSKKIARAVIVTIASLAVIVGVFFSVFQLELDHNLDEEGGSSDNSDASDGDDNNGVNITAISVLDSYLFSLGVVVLDFILEKLYLFVRGFLIYTSVLEADLHIVNYEIYISLLLFVGVPIFSGFGGTDFWFIQLTRLIFIYFLRKILARFIAIFSTHKYFAGARKAISKGKIAVVMEYFERDYAEFNFIDGNAEMIPLIFIATTFYMVSPYILLPILIVCLYILALLDKYRMTRCCDLFKTKSPVYTLNAFKVYRFAPHFVWWGGFISVTLTNLEAVNNVLSDSVLLVVVIGYFFVLGWSILWWPNMLGSKIKRRFLERNRKVEYDSVKKEFSAFFGKQRLDVPEMQKSGSLAV